MEVNNLLFFVPVDVSLEDILRESFVSFPKLFLPEKLLLLPLQVIIVGLFFVHVQSTCVRVEVNLSFHYDVTIMYNARGCSARTILLYFRSLFICPV